MSVIFYVLIFSSPCIFLTTQCVWQIFIIELWVKFMKYDFDCSVRKLKKEG